MRRSVALVMVLLVAFGAGVCSRRRGAAPRNVLLITLDTLRADRLGAYGYAAAITPRLDALARRGARFEQASSVMPLTLPAHSSLMTGTFPAYHGVRDNGGFYLGEQAETLAEVLSARGFRTGGFVGAFVLDSRWGIAQGFDQYFDEFDLDRFVGAAGMDAIQRPGKEVVDRALEWIHGEKGKFFAWVHLYDAHTPYEAPDRIRLRFPATRSGAYDAEIASLDEQVGRLLDGLMSSGQLDDTLVVVVGDHGEMLGEHEEITHGFFVYQAALRVPLIVAGPGIAATVIAPPVRLVDVMPTVLGQLGLPIPAPVQGSDLAPMLVGQSLPLLAVAESWYPRFHYGWSELVSISDGDFKLIRAPRRELYDLAADPGELHDLAQEDSRRADVMERQLARLLESVTGEASSTGPRELDAEVAQRLQALGYLSGGSSRHLEDRERADPKDKIGLYNMLKEATSLASLDRVEEATAKVRSVLEQDPEIVEAHLVLGNLERKAARDEPAVAAFRRALELDSENHEALYQLALAYKETGRLGEALVGFERAAALDSRSGRVAWQLADVLMQQRDFVRAEAELQRGLALDIDKARFLRKLGECYHEMGREPESERTLRESLATDDQQPGSWFALGLVLEATGRIEEAKAAYGREIEVHPDEATRARFNLGLLQLKSGAAQEASELFAAVVASTPNLPAAHLYLAKAQLDLGELQLALRSARVGLEMKPTADLAPLGHFVRADAFSRLGRDREAAKEAAWGRRLQAAASGGG